MKNRIFRFKKNPFVTIVIHSFVFLTLMICWPLSSVYDLLISNAVAAVIADPTPDQSVCKDLPLASHVTFNPDAMYQSNDIITFKWFGPFETNDQLSPSVIIPEGRYTVSHIINSLSDLSDVTTSLIEVTPCFTIAARDKTGKVQLTWSPVADNAVYAIFRAHESDSQQFEQIAETVSDYATYLDYGVQNESSYLYLVRASVDGEWSYSNVVSAHPTAVRARPRPNYAPLIYSSPIYNGTVGIQYNYDVNATDPNSDTLSYSLISSPDGMGIAQNTGLITWTPETDGTYPVSVRVEDGNGGFYTQDFTITAEQMTVPVVVDLNVEPQSIPEGGGPVTLTWSSAAADTVSIDNGIGPVDLNGTRVLSLQAPTTFTITAAGPGGTKTDAVTINYRPSVSLQIAPESILKGDSALLSWSSSHADTVSIAPDIGTVSPGGSIHVSPAITTTYTITATGPDSHYVAEAVLSVFEMPTATIGATPQTIKAGESVILTWHTDHAGSVGIDQGIGNVGPNGSVNVSPSATTTYTLTATGPGGTATNQTTVIVLPAPVINFSATPQGIGPGGISSLTWSCSHADAVSIDNGIGMVSLSGSLEVTPPATTTYTITATGSGGTKTAQAVVTVNILPTINFSVDPAAISAGQSATLTWTSENADTVTVDQGIGTVVKNGSLVVSPAATTTFTIIATGSGGTTTAQAVVTIIPPPVISFNADPSTISAGQSATLTWSSVNADSVSIDQGIGTVAKNGSLVVSPMTTTTYTITATGGEGGVVTANAVVTVIASPISLQITSPSNGNVIQRSDVMVTGAFSNTTGNEIGIVVNGFPALVYDGQFVANHVALQEGQNTLTVTATDTAGNTVSEPVTVTASPAVNYVRVLAIPESGVSPLETRLKIDGSFSIAQSSIHYNGPGTVTFLESSAEEWTISATEPGLYYFTVDVEKDTVIYSDIVAVMVMDANQLDSRLQAMFAKLRTALAAGDIETAVSSFTTRSQEKYKNAFEDLSGSLSRIAADMGDIELIYVHEDVAKYRIYQTHEIDGAPVDISFYIYFRIDMDGNWKIAQF
jgi:hypothetical protein